MSGYQNSVSVFHFTNRISSAKIKKYKTATQRGMDQTGQRASSNQPPGGPVVTPAPQIEPAGTLHMASASPPLDPASSEPPSKKPRLSSSVNPGTAGSPAIGPTSTPGAKSNDDTIEVARPGSKVKQEDGSLQRASVESSPLSSPAATPPPPKPVKMKTLRQRSPSPADPDYGDLMNYYILDGGEEDKPKPKDPKPPKEPKPRQPRAPKQQQQQQQQQLHQYPPRQYQQFPPQPNGMPLAPQYQQRPPHPAYAHQGPPGYYRPQQPPPQQRQPPRQPPPPPLILPQVQLIDFEDVTKQDLTRGPATVEEMIKCLEKLSAHLAGFGGPPGPAQQQAQAQQQQQQPPKPPPMPEEKPKKPVKVVKKNKKGDVVGSLLDIFDGDDSSDEAEEEVQEVQEVQQEQSKEPEQPPAPSLNYVLEHPGQADGPLTYGIKFIQNALRSWAQQRLTHSMGRELHQQAQQWAQQQAAMKKRGPGRPRKFTGGEDEQQQEPPNHPPPMLIKADTTPEGQAVKSFQEVIDSGCLQVNAVLPVELTRALRHLYMQIDQLINQGAKKEEKWECMSYGAQIAAHKTRLEKAKEAHAKAQEEIARQNQLNQQHVLQQMGLPPTPAGQPTNEATRQHELELERRRSQQHAQQQPYLKQHHLNPLLLGSQPPGTPVGFAPSQSPANVPGSQAPTPVSASATPHGLPSQPSPVNAQNPQHMEKVKMYMPGYMPRSGTQMKFSFTPTDPKALQTFGQQAFPAGPQIPNIPGFRATQAQPPMPNGAQSPAGTPVVRSIETPVQAHQGSSDVIEISEKEAKGGDRDEDVEMVDAVQIKKEPAQTPAPAPSIPTTGGFTAVNAPQQPIVINTSSPAQPNGPAGSPILGSSAATVSKMKPQQSSAEMASRYPHPGAVVVDQ